MNQLTWDELKNTLKVGSLIVGVIIRHEPYGVLVNIGYEYDGLIQITDFLDEGIMTPERYPPIATKVNLAILGFKDHGCQVWLGIKPSQLQRTQNLLVGER